MKGWCTAMRANPQTVYRLFLHFRVMKAALFLRFRPCAAWLISPDLS